MKKHVSLLLSVVLLLPLIFSITAFFTETTERNNSVRYNFESVVVDVTSVIKTTKTLFSSESKVVYQQASYSCTETTSISMLVNNKHFNLVCLPFYDADLLDTTYASEVWVFTSKNKYSVIDLNEAAKL